MRAMVCVIMSVPNKVINALMRVPASRIARVAVMDVRVHFAFVLNPKKIPITLYVLLRPSQFMWAV